MSRLYAGFAADEARAECPIYERLAFGVSESDPLREFLAALPAASRQPNLFFAAVRHLHGVPDDAAALAAVVAADGPRIARLMLSRTTQTNEPARCAVLLPLLAQLPQPLALLEVGASAGLCLLPDRYGYDYGAVRLDPPAAAAPVFPCAVSGPAPLPRTVPDIVWRRGLDLNPLDIASDGDIAWLETLVWPGQDARLRKLRAALAIARNDRPEVVRGDLLVDLPRLMASAPGNATLVVFHTAVLAYVRPRERRSRFAAAMRGSAAVWISNEAPAVFPDLVTGAPPAPAPGRFLLMQDGVPLAWTAAHGQALDWFGPR
ncbi:MAG: DUF2332 domain-containing protein [Alphaproteobacteria bacterium]|nr:DUF2332 domain-containing protein [Alphaproteobacteria bacterium]